MFQRGRKEKKRIYESHISTPNNKASSISLTVSINFPNPFSFDLHSLQLFTLSLLNREMINDLFKNIYQTPRLK